MAPLPNVRHLVPCEDVVTDPARPRRITLVGLLSAIRPLDRPAYPLLYREMCVYVQLADCRGPTDARVEVVHADLGLVAFRSRTRTLAVGDDPLEVVGFNFRLRDCLFPEAGLYWVEFVGGDRVLARQPLTLR